MAGACAVVSDLDRARRDRDLQEQDEREREEKSKNKDFVQMYVQSIPNVRMILRESPLAAEVFLFLTEKMDRFNALVCPTQLLADVTGKSRRQIERAIKMLREKGFVYITKAGSCNVYHLNPEIVWRSFDHEKKYCEFEGRILIARSENSELEIDWKRYTHAFVNKDVSTSD